MHQKLFPECMLKRALMATPTNQVGSMRQVGASPSLEKIPVAPALARGLQSAQTLRQAKLQGTKRKLEVTGLEKVPVPVML